MGYSDILSFNEGEYCCAGDISMAKLNSWSTPSIVESPVLQPFLTSLYGLTSPQQSWARSWEQATGPILPSHTLKQVYLLKEAAQVLLKVLLDHTLCTRVDWKGCVLGESFSLVSLVFFFFFFNLVFFQVLKKAFSD